jgi:ABC-type transport system involved in multi-copper enzyme maturation permease subunit
MIQAIQAAPPGHYRAKNIAKSEVVKMLTLRSTAIMLGLTVVGSLLVTWLATNSARHKSPGWYSSVSFDPTQQSMIGLIVACLIGGVFGALLITGEHASGTIRTTLSATPRRSLLLATKIAVAAVATLVVFELLSFVAFFLGEAILSGGGAPHANLGTPGALRAVVMTGAFITLTSLMSFGFGLIFRHTAAAIAAFAGVVFVLPLVMHGISPADLRYLPTNILTNSITATVNENPGAVSPALGLVLMAVYASIVLAVGCALFVRRDA